jgi:predicted TIM-barrel fold metal-dependent hydrolase
MHVKPNGSSESPCGCGLGRREFFALAGAAATVGFAGAGRAAPASRRDIVDVHAHYLPPGLQAAGVQIGPMGAWTLEAHLADMEKAGVTRSLLSITTPGIPLTGERGRALVRSSNEYAAKLCADHRSQLGFFTYVQLDDVDAALAELAYGFDTLKANGVGLFTSYGSKWLGDPVFDPVFEELERRRAVVYIHPTSAACCQRLIPSIAETLVEYGTDTTRAITSYIYRGAAARYPNVKMIWSHSGGTMPFLIERFDVADRAGPLKDKVAGGFRAAAGRFFYDIAQAANPVATTALRGVVPASQIVFGTDYPFRTAVEHVEALEAGRVFRGAELAALYRGNVARSMPQLVA